MHWNKILNHYFCIAAVIYTTILYTNKLILGLKSINLTWQVTELTNDYFRWHFTNFHSLFTSIWLESSWPLLPCLLIAFDLNLFHHRGIQGPCFYCLNFWWTAASFIIWLTIQMVWQSRCQLCQKCRGHAIFTCSHPTGLLAECVCSKRDSKQKLYCTNKCSQSEPSYFWHDLDWMHRVIKVCENSLTWSCSKIKCYFANKCNGFGSTMYFPTITNYTYLVAASMDFDLYFGFSWGGRLQVN